VLTHHNDQCETSRLGSQLNTNIEKPAKTFEVDKMLCNNQQLEAVARSSPPQRTFSSKRNYKLKRYRKKIEKLLAQAARHQTRLNQLGLSSPKKSSTVIDFIEHDGRKGEGE